MKIRYRIMAGFIIILTLGLIASGLSYNASVGSTQLTEDLARLAHARQLAQTVDVKFQLAISKAKNFVILKDRLNADRTLNLFNDADKTLNELKGIPLGEE